MKNFKTILSMIIVGCCVFIPMMSVDAKEISVENETELQTAITDAINGDVIVLEKSIDLTGPIEVVGKEITIDGTSDNKFTLYGNREATGDVTDNITLVTAVGEGSIVHLKNVNLYDSPKYGVQAYNGGYVSLDTVTIENCKYGAVLVNAGTVEVINLSLGANGEEHTKGIEISKGSSLKDSLNQPKVIMNGTIDISAGTEYAVYFASDANDITTDVYFENTESTTDKILVNGTTVVVADSNNEIKNTSNNVKPSTAVDGVEEYVPNIEVTDPVEPTEPIEEVSNEENPETSDGILLFLGLTIVGFVGVVLASKRLHN